MPSDLSINNICKGVAVCAVIVPNNNFGLITWSITVNGHKFSELTVAVSKEKKGHLP